MAAAQPGWCKSGWAQDDCVRTHVREPVPRSRDGGTNRECPACGANLSINTADIPAVWVIGHCFGGCDDEDVRDAMVRKHGIDEKCLGKFGRRRKAANGMPRITGTDPTALAAQRRSYAYAKLAGTDIGNVSLLRMCIQAISESDGDLAPDPEHLLPRDYAEFVALASRTGIERRHRYILATRYLSP